MLLFYRFIATRVRSLSLHFVRTFSQTLWKHQDISISRSITNVFQMFFSTKTWRMKQNKQQQHHQRLNGSTTSSSSSQSTRESICIRLLNSITSFLANALNISGTTVAAALDIACTFPFKHFDSLFLSFSISLLFFFFSRTHICIFVSARVFWRMLLLFHFM